MRIRKDIDFRLSLVSASGSEIFRLCVSILLPNSRQTLRKWGDKYVGEGSQQFRVLGCCGRVHCGVVSLLRPAQPQEALPLCDGQPEGGG